MAQDGDKEVQLNDDEGRRIFYIDVGDMQPKEALRVLNDIRKKQGMAPVSRSWLNWVLIGIMIVAAMGIAYTLAPTVLAMIPL